MLDERAKYLTAEELDIAVNRAFAEATDQEAIIAALVDARRLLRVFVESDPRSGREMCDHPYCASLRSARALLATLADAPEPEAS